MSPESKRPPSKKLKKTLHITERHSPTAAPTAEPPAPLVTFAVRVDGLRIADIAIAPSADLATTEQTRAILDSLQLWASLGAQLAPGGPHRLALAAHVARAAAGGGVDVARDEETALAYWFAAIVETAIQRTDGVQPSGFADGSDNPAARASWYLLASGDWIRDHRTARPSRCPAMAEVPCPGKHGFVDALRSAAPDYMRTVIAGATPAKIRELRELVNASDEDLEAYRPFAYPYGKDVAATESLETAISTLTRRRPTNEQTCQGFQGWAQAFNGLAVGYTIPPVCRVGAVAYLANVALRDEERAA